jgi:NAD(P)-dependent dehydrogenase (short-subunit alcohol dehydrogenase family)
MATKNASEHEAYIITGPTSRIGHATALELAKHGTVVLVGRDREKLDEVQKTIEQKGQHAVSVVCDLSDIFSVRRAAAEIFALNLPIAGLLNNAGIMQMRPTKNALGWDMTFATNPIANRRPPNRGAGVTGGVMMKYRCRNFNATKLPTPTAYLRPSDPRPHAADQEQRGSGGFWNRINR